MKLNKAQGKKKTPRQLWKREKIEKTATRIRNNRTDPTMRIMLENQIQQIEKRKTAQKQQGIPSFIFKDSPAR